MHKFLTVPPVWTCDLPVEFEPKWTCKDQLPTAIQQYSDNITAHQSSLNEVHDIDTNAWVIEPYLLARRSCTEGWVALQNTGGSLSIYILLDPLQIHNIPTSMRLLGSGADVVDLRNSNRKYDNDKNAE